MEKTEMMKRYEAETGESARDELYSGSMKLYMPTNDYIAWLEAKTNAYDRLMSGGRKTLKEWANFLGMCIAVQPEPSRVCFAGYVKPLKTIRGWVHAKNGKPSIIIPMDLIDFSGDWKTSLTFPDGWREK